VYWLTEFADSSFAQRSIDIITHRVTIHSVIASWRCDETRRLFDGIGARKFPPNIQRTARRKLLQMHAATELSQLAIPPGNRLEPLKGDRRGQHSIRINDQWRICFRWHFGNCYDVEIVDYH
jgi:proteic killer suppression protein